MTVPDGLIWMGVMTLAVTMLLFLVHFPQWDSMVFKANPEVTEEDYYIKEWDADEISQGLHSPSMRFAMESKSQRGSVVLAKIMPQVEDEKGAMKAVAEASSIPSEPSPAPGETLHGGSPRVSDQRAA